MDNTSTELQKGCDAESEIGIKKFWASLANYRQAQASILHLQAKKVATDEEMNEALSWQEQSIHAVLDTPIGTAHQLYSKFEVVEELIMKEDVVGKSRDNYPVLAMASLKRDLLALDGKTLNL